MNRLILFVCLSQLTVGLPQSSFPDYNRDAQGNPQRNPQGDFQRNPQGDFQRNPQGDQQFGGNRDFLPQSFSGNLNNTSSFGNNSPFPSSNTDRFHNDFQTSTRSTTRFDNRHDAFHPDQERNHSSGADYDHERYPGVNSANDPRTSTSTTTEIYPQQHPNVKNSPKSTYDRKQASGASHQSITISLIGFCCLLKFL